MDRKISSIPKKGVTPDVVSIELDKHYSVLSSAVSVPAWKIGEECGKQPSSKVKVQVVYQGKKFMLSRHRSTGRRVVNCPSCGIFNEVLYMPHVFDVSRVRGEIKCQACHGFTTKPTYKLMGRKADKEAAHALYLEYLNVDLSIQDIMADKLTSRHHSLPTLLSRKAELEPRIKTSAILNSYFVSIHNRRILQ